MISRLRNLGSKQSAIAKYLDTVDEVLFGARKGNNVRGWVSEQERVARREKGRRSSAPLPDSDSSRPPTEAVGSMVSGRIQLPGLSVTDEPAVLETLAEEEHGDVDGDGTSSLDDEDLPRWAQRSAFPDGRAPSDSNALLVALLPASLLPPADITRPSGTSEHIIIQVLALHRVQHRGQTFSGKPWGYINDDSIHDIVALEDALSASAVDGPQAEKGRKGWRHSDARIIWRLWGA